MTVEKQNEINAIYGPLHRALNTAPVEVLVLHPQLRWRQLETTWTKTMICPGTRFLKKRWVSTWKNIDATCKVLVL